MSKTLTDSVFTFSRGSLQLTAKILRKQSASLALEVQNILGQAVLPKPDGATENRMSDCFQCELDSFKVRAVVENLHLALAEAELSMHSDASRAGEVIMIKALTDDWILLASAMFTKLQQE
ncbi:MAG: hypothetical protein HRU38_02330 [Saccharospirillaceae bacterium]|nr:hypothetical protein [Pseudomonadales bacterium]NRB77497.1 hypothetical protein [Saccharospirillaceae bacterium]